MARRVALFEHGSIRQRERRIKAVANIHRKNRGRDLQIMRLAEVGKSQRWIADQYGISRGAVRKVLDRLNPAAVGRTVLVDGQPFPVLLPRFRGRPSVALVTPAPPCRRCDASLRPADAESSWRCPRCGDAPSPDAWARRLGGMRDSSRSRPTADTRHRRQVQRGAPGAAAILLRAAQDGGAPSRAYLLTFVTGPERRALRWALRTANDRPLSADLCRAAAAKLKALSS